MMARIFPIYCRPYLKSKELKSERKSVNKSRCGVLSEQLSESHSALCGLSMVEGSGDTVANQAMIATVFAYSRPDIRMTVKIESSEYRRYFNIKRHGGSHSNAESCETLFTNAVPRQPSMDILVYWRKATGRDVSEFKSPAWTDRLSVSGGHSLCGVLWTLDPPSPSEDGRAGFRGVCTAPQALMNHRTVGP